LDIHINKPILFEVKFIGDKGEFDKGVVNYSKIMKKENFSSSKDVRGAPTTWLLSSVQLGLGRSTIPPVKSTVSSKGTNKCTMCCYLYSGE
jgi:hypothetical protein